MPWSRMTSATAEISASVLRALSRVRTREQRQVGHDAREDLDVLDLPGHHRLRDAGRLENLDAPAEVPERHPVEVRLRLAGRRLQLRKRFLLHRDDGDVVAEGARALEGEKRESAVAGDEANPAHSGL